MKLAWKRIWSFLAPGFAGLLLSCSQQPSACEFAVTFDSSRDGRTEVYTLALDSVAVRQITDFPEPEIANRFPDWSHGGWELAFVSENFDGIGDLYIVAADDTGLRKLTSYPARYENPAWAQGGDWIAFEKGKGEDWGLTLIRPNTTARFSTSMTRSCDGSPQGASTSEASSGRRMGPISPLMPKSSV